MCLIVHVCGSFSTGQHLGGDFEFIRCAPSIVLNFVKLLSKGVARPHSELSVIFVSLTRSIQTKHTLPIPAWPDQNWQVAVISSSIITAVEWADLCPQKTLTGSWNVFRILCDEIFNPSLPYMAAKWLTSWCVSRTHLSESQPTLLHNWTTFCKFN